MIRPAWWRLAGVLLVLWAMLAPGESLTSRAAHLAARVATDAAQAYDATLAWVRLQGAGQPPVLYVGGSFACQQATVDTDHGCSDWALRSTDGGRTWTDLRPALGVPLYHQDQNDVTPSLFISPFIVAADGRRLYGGLTTYYAEGRQRFLGPLYVALSTDLGHHWRRRGNPWPNPGYPSRFFLYTVPHAPLVLYAVISCADCANPDLTVSSDGGLHWREVTNPLVAAPVLANIRIVGDPRHAATVYANITDYPWGVQPLQSYAVIRSTDGGHTWVRMSPPAARPPLRTFSVSTDAHLGTLLVGRTQDRSVPADRRYLSRDEGRTWRVATCPGDVRGQCPTYTVDNVFGAGASYGFVHASPDGRVRSGVYRFHGSGAAVARLDLSARLPVRVEDLLDVQAGHSAGDPIYLLSSGMQGTMHGLLWRSADGGRTWQQLLGGMQLTPNAFLRTRPRP